LIPLELGGGGSSEANLWPQPHDHPVLGPHNSGAKDALEGAITKAFCAGQAGTLREAQHEIASNWPAAYRKYVLGEQAPPPPPRVLPGGSCAPFAASGGRSVPCPLLLEEGSTYVVYTECASVKGNVVLKLLDQQGRSVGFNDGASFCPSDSGAALFEVAIACGSYETPSVSLSLEQGCWAGTECGARVSVRLSDKEPPMQCPPRKQ
jgi:hypothetical protein